jgi:arylsulfatase A-like enzyme
VFAAYVAYTDHEIGRVTQAIDDMGKLDNTLIIYINGDNGNSAEGTLIGTPNEVASLKGVEIPIAAQMKFYDAWGSDQTYPHMAAAWTWAFDTPFSWTKQMASHFGGVRQAMAISWPVRITDKGGIRNQFCHVIDIVPTILEATGIPAPAIVDGIPQSPIEGVSLAYTFDKANADAPSRHTTQYFEMMGDHAIYHDGWIASTKVMRPPWILASAVSQDPASYPYELYDLTKDWTQSDNLADRYPDKVKELDKLFWLEAAK